MVCFSQHAYHFSAEMREPWFNLLMKYHPNVSCTVNGQHGRISADFLKSIPVAPNYHVMTDRTWDQLATICAMPKRTQTLPGPSFDPLEAVISGRQQNQGNDCFIHNDIKPEVKDVRDHLGSLNPAVTHLIVSNEVAYMLVDGRYGIRFQKNEVSDANFPVLDLDDGFRANFDQCPQDWQDQWIKWKETFDKTQGASWNEPILVQK